MQEVEIDGRRYRTGKLDAFKQFHLTRKLLPLFGGLGEAYAQMPAQVGDTRDVRAFWKALEPIAQAISEMSTEDSEWCVKTCLAAVTMFNGHNWVPIMSGTQLMFEDIEMTAMLQLSLAVMQDNLGRFFPGTQPNGLDGEAQLSASISSP